MFHACLEGVEASLFSRRGKQRSNRVWGSGLGVRGVGFGVRGLGCRVWGWGFAVWGLRCRIWGPGCRVWGLGCRVWGLGCRVWGLKFGVWGVGFGVYGLRLTLQGGKKRVSSLGSGLTCSWRGAKQRSSRLRRAEATRRKLDFLIKANPWPWLSSRPSPGLGIGLESVKANSWPWPPGKKIKIIKVFPLRSATVQSLPFPGERKSDRIAFVGLEPRACVRIWDLGWRVYG